MNRQWIAVEQMDYIEETSIGRLKKVIAGEQVGISESVGWEGGGDFIYCELMQYNDRFRAQIQSAQSTEELLDIWREMSSDAFLKWRVNPKNVEEAKDDFISIGNVDKQKKELGALLDKTNSMFISPR